MFYRIADDGEPDNETTVNEASPTTGYDRCPGYCQPGRLRDHVTPQTLRPAHRLMPDDTPTRHTFCYLTRLPEYDCTNGAYNGVISHILFECSFLVFDPLVSRVCIDRPGGIVLGFPPRGPSSLTFLQDNWCFPVELAQCSEHAPTHLRTRAMYNDHKDPA